MPTAAFFHLRKAEKERRGVYPIGRVHIPRRSSASSLAPSDSVSQSHVNEAGSGRRNAYPREHEAEWRAQTGFCGQQEAPYYEAENDFEGNYLVDVVPREGR
ncbi:hypothetical protein Tdes44962_MAKER04068 [Teratosphaeria destructans]|uniref:Uncharacterized protein n=1 Tax=Teratosphaeria destructans TaxID=418781 RepID=A0A9W7SNG5_9PEZI|nr:hypothetical protein Tdes44962_MAKER04068 [Teratosphaeria destructans]